jgi:hypothetical protein
MEFDYDETPEINIPGGTMVLVSMYESEQVAGPIDIFRGSTNKLGERRQELMQCLPEWIHNWIILVLYSLMIGCTRN